MRAEKNYQKAMEGLQKKGHIWLDPALLRQLRIQIGDKVKIGNKEFIAADAIASDSGSSWGGVGLAPKIYISKKNLQDSGLISFGSVVSYAHLYKLRHESSPRNSSQSLSRSLKKLLKTLPLIFALQIAQVSKLAGPSIILSDYLGLVGLVALFLAGIGAGYLFQNYLFEKLQDVAILKKRRYGAWIYIFRLSFSTYGLKCDRRGRLPMESPIWRCRPLVTLSLNG